MSGYNEALMRRAAAEVDQFVVGAAAYFIEQVVTLNNEGGDSAPPAPIDTQNLRGSLRVTVGSPSGEAGEARPYHGGSYPLTRPAEARRVLQLGGFNLGDVVWARWIAPYANIIDGGRRTDRNGRPIGSLQAPDGWVAQGIAVALLRLSRWRYRP